MNHQEMIDVIQAHKDGKQIQCRHYCRDDWQLVGCPNWNFDTTEYRARLEPREVYILENKDKSLDRTNCINAGLFARESRKVIKFREVIE